MKRKSIIALSMLLILALGLSATASGTQKRKRKGYLGVHIERLSILEKKELGISHGILVTDVVKDSPAEKAGMLEDDIILYFAGKKIRKSNDLTEKVRNQKPKSSVKVTLLREGKRTDLNVVVGRLRNRFSVNSTSLSYFYGHAYLGVRLHDMDNEMLSYFGVKEDEGVLVLSVVEDSPAAEGGLKSGDVIYAIEGEDVGDSGDITEILGDFEEGEEIEVAVLRHKRKVAIKVTLSNGQSYNNSMIFGGDDFIHIHSDGAKKISEISELGRIRSRKENTEKLLQRTFELNERSKNNALKLSVYKEARKEFNTQKKKSRIIDVRESVII
ncbi:PDZ domain-containing protein [bacterium]|nr:PDZ domain-containing protein [bacterium]